MQVLFLVPFPTEAPGNRLRVEQYLPWLTRAGIDYQVRPFVSPSHYRVLYQPGHKVAKVGHVFRGALSRLSDLLTAHKWDVVFIYREAWPFGTALPEKAFARITGSLIFDFDDSIFLHNTSDANSQFAWIKRPQKTGEIIKVSNYVIAGNNYLKGYALRYNQRVTVIPTPVDTDMYSPRQDIEHGAKVVIGWIGTHSTARYLHALENVFNALMWKYPDVEIWVISNGGFLTGIPNVRNIFWSLEDEVELLSAMDIGIMPMPDDPWTRGKCGFKALLYMSMGLPVVCSPVGVNRQIVRDRVNGFTARSEDEWLEKLALLIEDTALRRTLGKNGKQMVEEEYSVKVWAPRFVGILADIGATRKREKLANDSHGRDRSEEASLRKRTANSFAYEWQRFNVPPEEMQANFWGYFQPFSPDFFKGKRVLEAGSGMGRHTYYLSQFAREVVAIDLGEAIRVAAINVAGQPNVRLVQADIDYLPFPSESFDFICSIGVLHHLPDTEAGLVSLLRCLRPGGVVHLYLYWALEDAPVWKRGLLILVTAVRRITVRLPFWLVEKLAWLMALIGYGCFSIPYRYLSRWRATRAWVEDLPLQRYAKDGFRVCYNDQFDRLTAPLERRFSRAQVKDLLSRSGLADIHIEPHYGWLAYGRKPENPGK